MIENDDFGTMVVSEDSSSNSISDFLYGGYVSESDRTLAIPMSSH